VHSTAAKAYAYELMVFHWGEAYEFSHDDRPGIPEPYTARRRDDPSVVLTDADPEKLTDKVYRNYLERPVPRDAAP
jgi:hypothetical protein